MTIRNSRHRRSTRSPRREPTQSWPPTPVGENSPAVRPRQGPAESANASCASDSAVDRRYASPATTAYPGDQRSLGATARPRRSPLRRLVVGAVQVAIAAPLAPVILLMWLCRWATPPRAPDEGWVKSNSPGGADDDRYDPPQVGVL